MEINVGKTDAIIRVVLGIIFLVLFVLAFFEFNGNFMYNNWILAIVFAILGVVMLVTAYTKRCALYSLFGIKTN